MTTDTIDTKAAFEKIQDHCPNKDTRTIDKIKKGEGIRQGDLYMVYLGPPGSAKIDRSKGVKASGQQLAPGTTQGSRHVAVGTVTVISPGPTSAQLSKIKGIKDFAIAGPLVEAPNRWSLTHPEHADFDLPKGDWATIYQTDPRTRQRVLD